MKEKITIGQVGEGNTCKLSIKNENCDFETDEYMVFAKNEDGISISVSKLSLKDILLLQKELANIIEENQETFFGEE